MLFVELGPLHVCFEVLWVQDRNPWGVQKGHFRWLVSVLCEKVSFAKSVGIRKFNSRTVVVVVLADTVQRVPAAFVKELARDWVRGPLVVTDPAHLVLVLMNEVANGRVSWLHWVG